MQAFWYRLLVDINRDELHQRAAVADRLRNEPGSITTELADPSTRSGSS